MAKKKQPGIFTRFTSQTSTVLGRPWSFVASLLLLVVWGLTGPLLKFSDTWQLVINTTTTIITFLMVFIIQNTQNRDSLAHNLKLDAILIKLGIDEDDLMAAEEESDKDLEAKKNRIQKQSSKNSHKAPKPTKK